jgi:small subunit ribosomal protein S19
MAKEILFKGKRVEELKQMSNDELGKFLNARSRRTLKRGFTTQQKKLIDRAKKAAETKAAGKEPKPIKTHQRDMIILPSFVGLKFSVHNGKEFKQVEIQPEMIGHFFGEFALTRKRIEHGSPGVGASRSSKFVPIK